MDFDELSRMQRSIAAAMGDSVTRSLQESITRSLQGADSVAKSIQERVAYTLRETDVTRSLQGADSVAKSIQESVAYTLRETDVARSLQGADSVAKSIQESVAYTLRETDVARSLQEADSVAKGIRDNVARNERLLGAVSDGFRETTNKYLELQESIQRNLSLQSLQSAGISSTFRELLRQAEYKDWTSSVSEVAKQVGLAYELVRRSGIEELRNRAELLGSLTTGSPVLGMLTRDLISSASAGTLTPALVNGFGSELMSYIEGAETADSEEEVLGFLQTFFAWLLVQVQRLPGTKLSGEAIFSILLTVLTLLDARYLDLQNDKLVQEEARKAKEETLGEMREMETRLTEKLAQMETAGRKDYIIVQAANLRKGPGENFESLRVLPPNLLVEEIERDGEWSHVQYFDYAEGEARDGWVLIALLVARHDDER